MAKKSKKFSPEPAKILAPPPYTCPAISVIIPMYNVEKYVGECLESLLAQTFGSFEVIVVNDCSTDSSAAIVESYAARFNGRLKLSHMKENSGTAGFPRNKGIELSCGEYLYFMDADDAITPTALEELHGLAKKFDADVVHCEKNFEIPDELWYDANYRKNLRPNNFPTRENRLITEPTLLTEDFELRAMEFCQVWLNWTIWNQLFRREFVIENGLKFVDAVHDDKVFTICVICSAKRYLVVPNVIYSYRLREGSVVHSPWDLKFLRKQTRCFRNGMKYISDYLGKHEPFAQRPDLRYAMLDFFAAEVFPSLEGIYVQVPAPDLDEILQQEFGGEDSALLSFLFSAANIYRHNFFHNAQRAAELEGELKRRGSRIY